MKQASSIPTILCVIWMSLSPAPTAAGTDNAPLPDPQALAIAIFHAQYEQLYNGVTNDNLSAIYDFQILTNPLLLMAIQQGSTGLLDSLAAILISATNNLQSTTHYPMNSWNRRDSVPLGKTYKIWLYPRPLTLDKELITVREEVILASSQFLFMAAQLLRHALTLPAGSYQNIDRFVSIFPSLLLEHHYQRWVIDTRPFRLTGWKCARGTYNHHEFLRLKKTRRFLLKKPHCPVVTDTDLFIIAGVSMMVAAHAEHPDRVVIPSEHLKRYREYLHDAEKLLERRVELRPIDLPDIQIEGFAFDNGMYRRYADHRYALYTSPEFPSENVKPPIPRDAAWDLSHARRFFFIFHTMEMASEKANLTLDYGRYLDALARQFYHVVYTDTVRHLFTNYINGDNGWYRVNYHGEGFGFPPYSLSLAALEGGWFFLGNRYPPIAELGNTLWETFNKNPEIFNQYYGVVYRNHQPTHRSFDTRTNGNIRLNLLQWLPALERRPGSEE